MRRLALVALAAAFAAGSAPAARAPGLLPTDRSPFPGGRPFAATSPFNRPLPAEPRLHARSRELVRALVGRAMGGLVLATGEWTIPVFRASATTPRHDVRLTAPWSPYAALRGVPIPAVAQPDPQGDGHLAIVDGPWVWELWQARRTATGWRASWGNRISLAGSGVYPYGLSARGSGFSLLTGIVWPHELARGRIEHALLFSTSPNRGGVRVLPASESDGTSRDPLTLPEGARLQLDPALDLDTLGLRPWERTIARAMQRYGLILGDDGADSVAIYAAHPMSFGGWTPPYPLHDGVGVLDRIPLERLRVLAWGRELPLDADRPRVANASLYRPAAG